MKIHNIYPLALASLMTFPSAAVANKIKKLDISPLDGYAEAPTIEVYSTNGEQWNAVDKTEAVHFKVYLNAKCQFEGRGQNSQAGPDTQSHTRQIDAAGEGHPL